MYPVSANFHTLSVADAPKTRVRIYFIGSGVDCWDDNDVQTNGTLLVGAVGDTDSNGRIGQDGITFTEIYNKDQNLEIGGTVSYQIEMTLLNTDGALDNFAFGRCKVYLDVYDAANSAWLPCPMGVFRIELPVKRKVQLVSCYGYDQMQILNETADTWWNGLNFSGGLTITNILNSMVTQLGLHLSSASSSAMVNSSLSYTTAPFDSVERTYRDILGWIAEATGTVARFNRYGELDMRQYLTPQIGGSNIVINTNTTGNQCLSIDAAEYVVSKIDALTIKLTTADQGVTVGSGTNAYTIMDNPFLYGDTVTIIQNKLTPIYNRLNGYFNVYRPLSARIIADWSIEAGDLIFFTVGSRTIGLFIFAQKMTWRGGYVVSEMYSTGDAVRPQVSGTERETYRVNKEMATKVGDNEIISRINQSPEAITIQASKVDLTGYVTFTNLSTPGQTTIDGGNLTTGTISADRIAAGSLSIGKLDTATQNTINTAASNASTALSDAAAAQSTANSANSQEQLIFISRTSGTTTQSATTTWVTNTTGNQNTWTIKRPTYNSSYPVLFVATQRKNVAGTVTCTTPQIDNTTTVIDGGHITTGTIDASVVSVTNLNASNISSGTLSADRIAAGSLAIGKLDSTTQNTITTAASEASTALTNAATAQSTAEGANSQEQLIYISKASGTTTQSGTTTWVTNATGNQNTWTIKRPTYNSSYPVLFVATQRKSVGGTVTCTTPQIDNTTTVIDGGHITTGTIDASVVSVTNLNASNITSGTMSANKISGGSIDASNVTITNLNASNITSGSLSANYIQGGIMTVGGLNNTNGYIRILDSTGNYAGGVGASGITLQGEEPYSGLSHVISNTIFPYGHSLRDQTTQKQLINVDVQIPSATDEYAKYYIQGYDSGTQVSRVEFSAYPYNNGAYLILQGPNGLVRLNSDGTYTGDLTINYGGNLTIKGGVLDVVDRRSVATLSSAGWYRILTFTSDSANYSNGYAGSTIDFNIGRKGQNETHKISLHIVNGNIKFDGEDSVSYSQIIDKIRYSKKSEYGYVDIHTTGACDGAYVDFVVHDQYTKQSQYVATDFSKVGPSPSGETIVTEHTFSSTAYSKTVSAEGTANGWDYILYTDKTIDATRKITDTVSNYTTVNGFYGYYISNILTPFSMSNADYYVGTEWAIGTGFAIPAAVMSKTTSKFNAYALGTASGSQSVSLTIHLKGTIA